MSTWYILQFLYIYGNYLCNFRIEPCEIRKNYYHYFLLQNFKSERTSSNKLPSKCLQRQKTSHMNNMIAALNWWIIWKVFSRNILPTFCLKNMRIYDGIRRLFLPFDGLCQKFNALMALKYVQKGLYWHISQLLIRRINKLGIPLTSSPPLYKHAYKF